MSLEDSYDAWVRGLMGGGKYAATPRQTAEASEAVQQMHKLDWNLCLLLLGKGKPASNTEISSSIIYRSKQTCIKNKGDRQQLSPSFQKLGRTLPKLFLIAFREIGR